MSSSIPERPVVDGDWDAWGAGVDEQIRLVPGLARRTLAKRIVTGAYTLVADDLRDTVLHINTSSAVTITLPAGLTQETAIPWRQAGSGQVAFVAGSGMALVSRGGATKSAGQWAGGIVTCVADAVWLLEGDIT